MTNSRMQETIWNALDTFRIEVPSWGFANTGTRFGKFLQPAAATNIEEKLSDAGQVHRHTGCCPRVAVHVLWDFPEGTRHLRSIMQAAEEHGVQIGSINPTLFQDQIYKYGSLGNPDPEVRSVALQHILDSIALGQACGSRDLSLWFADGSNYPGTANIRHRRKWFEQGLQEAHAHLADDQRLLIEYKPFEPAFYHSDVADWGMALLFAFSAGSKSKVLVDTGHHYQAQNIEQIVAWLLSENRLGGFHLNNRRYADDDLTIGSIDPYQDFRVFNEILFWEWETGTRADLAYVVDQSHNMKGKIEAMIQTAVMAQELFAKASLVDHQTLAVHQATCSLVDAEECLRSAFYVDVRPILREWRHARGLPEDPMAAFRQSGYLDRITRERADKNRTVASTYA